jgi:TNF receptor-associated protein 1
MFEHIDEYVISSLHKFDDKDLKSVNADDIDLGDSDAEGESPPRSRNDHAVRLDQRTPHCPGRYRPPRQAPRRLPGPRFDPEGEMTPQMRQMMKALGKDGDMPGPKVIFEINPRHNLVKGLSKLHQSDPETAGLISEQILDNACSVSRSSR